MDGSVPLSPDELLVRAIGEVEILLRLEHADFDQLFGNKSEEEQDVLHAQWENELMERFGDEITVTRVLKGPLQLDVLMSIGRFAELYGLSRSGDLRLLSKSFPESLGLPLLSAEPVEESRAVQRLLNCAVAFDQDGVYLRKHVVCAAELPRCITFQEMACLLPQTAKRLHSSLSVEHRNTSCRLLGPSPATAPVATADITTDQTSASPSPAAANRFAGSDNETTDLPVNTGGNESVGMALPAAITTINQPLLEDLTRTFNSSRVMPWSTIDPTYMGDRVLFHKKEGVNVGDWMKHVQRAWTYFRQTDETMIRLYGSTQLRLDDNWQAKETDVYAQLLALYSTFVRATCLESLRYVPVLLRFLSEDGDEWILVRNVDRTFNWYFGPTKSARAVRYATGIHEKLQLDVPCEVCLVLLEVGFPTAMDFVPYLQSLFDQIADGTSPLTDAEYMTVHRAIEVTPPSSTTASSNAAQEQNVLSDSVL